MNTPEVVYIVWAYISINDYNYACDEREWSGEVAAFNYAASPTGGPWVGRRDRYLARRGMFRGGVQVAGFRDRVPVRSRGCPAVANPRRRGLILWGRVREVGVVSPE